MSSDNLTAMISEWQELISSEDVGAWGYAPASIKMHGVKWAGGSLNGHQKKLLTLHGLIGNLMKQQQHGLKSILVLQCDGPGRFKFDGIFPITFETYGEKIQMDISIVNFMVAVITKDPVVRMQRLL